MHFACKDCSNLIAINRRVTTITPLHHCENQPIFESNHIFLRSMCPIELSNETHKHRGKHEIVGTHKNEEKQHL